MEILLWLVPPALVTLVTMVWVSWLGRDGRGEVDREVAVRRLGQALENRGRRRRRRSAPGYAVVAPAPDRSTGVAVRSSRRPASRPEAAPSAGTQPVPPVQRERRAS